MKYDRKILKEYVEKGLLKESKHPNLPLYLYKYTEKCQFENKWDEITKACRGLVLDEEGNVVVNCMPKFFNYEQEAFYEQPDLPYTVYPKLDGSLIQAAWWAPENWHDELIVTSSGSFSSWHAKRAEDLLSTPLMKQHDLDYGKTYIFELVGPDNRIVVDYKEERLILLAVRETKTGIELPLELFSDTFEVAQPLGFKHDMPISFLAEEIARQDFLNEEGFIVKYSNGQRIKFKYHQYVHLHKIMTGVSEKWVWETLKSGNELVLDSVPDEVYDWVKDVRSKLAFEHVRVENKCQWLCHEVQLNHGAGFLGQEVSRKDFAITITNPKSPYFQYKHIMFAMYDGKPYDHMIWEMIKPEGETRKFAANAATHRNAKSKDGLYGYSGDVYFDEISGKE